MPITLNHYRTAVTRHLPLLLGISLLTAVLAYGIATRLGPTHQVHFSYLISLSEREPSTEFRFDGYYALQATDLFATTLARVIGTPEVIVAAHQAAELPLPTTDARQVTRLVRAEKTAPQLVEVTVSGDNQETALRLAEGVKQVVDHEVARYHEQGIPALRFRTVPTAVWPSTQALALPLITVATFVAALFLGINLVLLTESFKHLE